MADLRIVDAPVLLQESITDDVKMPTGGLGNYAIRLGDLVWYIVTKEQLASKDYVDNSSKDVQDKLDTHIADKNNPHNITKEQVGLGNVDNTADVDKPVSNAVNSAIITATTDMATKAYVNQKDNLKADKVTTYTKDETFSQSEINGALSLKADISYVNNKDGDLATLITTDKTNLVKAINEVGNASKGVVALYNKNIEVGAGNDSWSDLIIQSTNINQRQINDGLGSINQLLAIKNPRDGQRVYVKSYHEGYNRGGGWFTFDSSKVSFKDEFGRTVTNDKGRFINGWVRDIPNNEFTPEMFGAYGEAETLGFDDYQAIEDMLQSLIPMTREVVSVEWGTLSSAWAWGTPRVVRLDSLYKHSKTIYLPPNIKIKQSNFHHAHSRRVAKGLWYSPPVEKRATTCAVSTYAYIKDKNAELWSHNTDIFSTPLENYGTSEFWNIELENLTIITDQDVMLGLRIISNHVVTRNLTIGAYIKGYGDMRNPKVGLLHFYSYVSTHYDTRIRADMQAVVLVGANASVAFYNPWLTQSNRPQQSSSYVLPYKTDAHTETGSAAITFIDADGVFYSPTYENWNISVLCINTRSACIFRPHNESLVLKHEFYLINSSIKVEFKESFGHYSVQDKFDDWDGSHITYSNYSCLYLKNCEENNSVVFEGIARYVSAPVVRGENSERILDFNVTWTEAWYFTSYGKIGDYSLVRNANFKQMGATTIHVNPTTGNDENNGLHWQRPRKTLKDLDTLVDRCGIDTIVVEDAEVVLTENIALPKSKFKFLGKPINLNSKWFTAQNDIDVIFANEKVYNSAYAIILGDVEFINANVKFTSQVDAATIVRIVQKADLDLYINSPSVVSYGYVKADTPDNNLLGLKVKTTSAIPATPYPSGVTLKYKSANIPTL